MDGIERMIGTVKNREVFQRSVRSNLRVVLSMPTLEERYPFPGSKKYAQAVQYLQSGLEKAGDQRWILLFGWVFMHELGKLSQLDDFQEVTNSWVNEWQFSRVLQETAQTMGVTPDAAEEISSLLKILTDEQCWFDEFGSQPLPEMLNEWLSNTDIQRYLNINRYEEMLWFNQERFESFVWWMTMLAVFQSLTGAKASTSLLAERLLLTHEMAQKLLKAEKSSGFQVGKLVKALKK